MGNDLRDGAGSAVQVEYRLVLQISGHIQHGLIQDGSTGCVGLEKGEGRQAKVEPQKLFGEKRFAIEQSNLIWTDNIRKRIIGCVQNSSDVSGEGQSGQVTDKCFRVQGSV